MVQGRDQERLHRGGICWLSHFINELETVKIAHEGHDRLVFAQGALEAAKFVMDKEPGIYTMRDVLNL